MMVRIRQIFALLSAVALGPFCSHSYAMVDYQRIKASNDIVVDVVKITDLSQLKLFLNDTKQRPYRYFSELNSALPNCEQLNFAMNAGMYHADYAPVGLYIEQGKKLTELNEQTGYGNFFMQPNGVLAWNSKTATLLTTAQYKKQSLTPQAFKADYATQSGPMLVMKGQINPQFVADGTSLKIRNGVGVKNNQLYFVMSRDRVNFYQFATFFKNDLNVEDALYLDGSISSVYIPQAKRHDRRYALGPMLAVVEKSHCEK